MTTRSHRTLALALAPLLLSAPLLPRPAAAGEPRRLAVSAAPDADEGDGRRIRSLLFGLGVDADQVEIVHGVERFLADADPGLFGPSTGETCHDLPLSAADFEASLREAEDRFPLADHDGAVEGLTALRLRLPCLVEPVPPERLHRLYLLEGVALYYTRGREPAREAFWRALGVDPDYDWRGEFGPGPQEVHIEAARALLNADRALLWVALASPGARVLVDGVALDLAGGQARATLTTSPHLVQTWADGRPPTTVVVDLTGGTVLIDRAALQAGIHALSQGGEGGLAAPALEALSSWLPAHGYDDGFVVLTARAARLERRTHGGGDAEPAPRQKVMRIDPVARETRRPFLLPERMNPYPWHGAVAVAGGLLLYERDGNSYTYGSVLTTAMFPALPNMGAGFTWGVATRHVSGTDQTVYIVPLLAHVRFGPDHGPLRPYGGVTGAALWLGERVGPQFSAGILGAAGLDIRPADDRTLGFGAGVSAGYVGGGVVDVHMGVSLQW